MWDKFYDKIPAMYKGKLAFVDRITRQAFDLAIVVSCDDDTANAFRLDLDRDNSWFGLTPQPRLFSTPEAFEPDRILQITRFHGYSSAK